VIADARVVLHDAAPRKLPAEGRRYPHLAIHPYPSELEGEIALRDRTRLPMRPMRPEDTELELAFFRGLSERSRYHRFMQHLPELPPRMLARFTQLDYDRELALVVLHEGQFVAVGRYAPTLDGTSAEFALTVADAWQAKGIGRALLERLCHCARDAGYEALYGYILADNRDMLQLASKLGFTEVSRSDEVLVMRKL
jgi:acetyltransferase